MNIRSKYGKKYFDQIYARLKREKSYILKFFFGLLISQKKTVNTLLDLGCGEGDFLKICQAYKFELFGVDISRYALNKVKKVVRGKFIKADLEKDKLPYANDYFDVITAFDLIEHLKDPQLLLTECRRVIKKDGLLFLSTLNGGYWLGKFLNRFFIGDQTHVNVQNSDYWCQSIEQAGFKKITLKGCILFGFPPTLGFRYWLRQKKIPVITRPIFSPLMGFNSELFIFARK